MLAGGGTSALADVTTSAGEVGRSGWDGAEPGLSPAAVRSGRFQQLYSAALSGQALGQPLVYGSTVIVSTELDLVYGIDSTSGALRWTTRLGTPQPVSSVPQLSCGDITPSVGITTTPVIDPASGLLYVTARTWDAAAADPQAATWVLVALSAVDGREAWRVPIQGAASNDPGAVFDPNHQNQRPGLLLMNGWVYAGFGSFCDFDPYRGWVVGVNVSTREQTLWTDEAGQAGSPRAGIWQTGALASDGPGRILLVSGNGIVPPAGPGTAPPSALGNAVVRLSVGTNGTLSAVDFFAPGNAQTLAKDDLDLGSAGLAVAPAVFPLPAALSTTHPHLAAIAGKEGKLYLVDQDNLGGEAQGPGGTDAAVATAGPYPLEHVFTRPAFWPGNGGRIYLVTQPLGGPFGFGTGVLRAFRLDSSGRLVPAGTGRSVAGGARSEVMGFGSGTPMVTSAGTKAGSAVVWMVQRRLPKDGPSRLLAFSAVPDPQGLMPQLRSFDIGAAAKFSAPATDRGRVYVATQDGRLLAFGQGPPLPPPAQGIVMDAYGGLHGFASAGGSRAIDTTGAAYWPGWNIARGLTVSPGGRGGYVVDGYGGIHRFGSNQGPDYLVAGSAYWSGWDIARGIAATTGGGGGYVLDGYGGVHAFGGAPPISNSSHAYWQGWDIARAIVMRPDGISGYVLDGWGGVHAFGGAPNIPNATHAYWPGWDIARGLVLDPSGDGGWILDAYGGIHRFGPSAPDWPAGGSAYWPGWQIARGITLIPGTDHQGYVLDGYGGLHAFGGAPDIALAMQDAYWPGWDIARGAGGS